MISKPNLKLGAGVLTLTLVGLLGGVIPAVNAVRSLDEQIARVRSSFTNVADRPQELQKRAASLEDARLLTVRHTKPIPAQGDVAGLIRGLSMTLDEMGITTREIATGAPGRIGDVVAMPMSLTMHADFRGIHAVIAHIESLPRLVRVRHVRIGRDSRADVGSTILKAELMLEVIYTTEGAEEDRAALEPVAIAPTKGAEP